MSLNHVALIGRLTEDPELRYTPNGKPVCNFSLAVNRIFSDDDEADFFSVTCWGKTAEATANHMTKGRQVAVSGQLRQDRWQTDEGQNRSRVKVNAQNVQFLGSGNNSNSGNSSTSSSQQSQSAGGQEQEDDTSDVDLSEADVPFD